MTRFLIATDSVHATAAACDYLQDRIGPDDAVRAVAVAGGDTDERDAAEALNVVTVRLPTADAETETREGDPVAELRAAVDAFGADEVVLAARSDPGASDLGETATAMLDAATVPVVVV
ncbi:MAG: universal stress protein [Halobacteriaceae archaeon]